MITVLIVEDDLLQLQALDTMLTEYNPKWNLLKASTYTDALTYIDTHNIQLFLFDVELNKENDSENGIALAKIIRTNDKYRHTPIIFITAIPEKIYEALNETHCYHYLLKPYDQKQFYAVLDAVTTSPLMQEHFILIKDSAGILVQLNQKDILYISNENHQLLFHTAETTFHAVGMSMHELLQKLCSAFVRCHKKYIINCEKVTNYDKTNRLAHIGNTELSVGRFYKKNFETLLAKT